jgi:methylmalonyl-CoA mutase
MLLAFFMNAAIDQQCEKYIEANNEWKQVNKAYLKKLNLKYIGSDGKACLL